MMVDIWIEKANQYGTQLGDPKVENRLCTMCERSNGEIDKIVHAYNYYGPFHRYGSRQWRSLRKCEI